MHLANHSESACTYILIVIQSFLKTQLQKQQLHELISDSKTLISHCYTVHYKLFPPFFLPLLDSSLSCLLPHAASSSSLFSLLLLPTFLSPLFIPFPALPLSLRTIYEKLGGAVSEEQRTLYTQRVEEISPNVRYCAYNMGDTQTDISQIMKLASDAPGYDMLVSKIDVRIKYRCSSHHPYLYHIPPIAFISILPPINSKSRYMYMQHGFKTVLLTMCMMYLFMGYACTPAKQSKMVYPAGKFGGGVKLGKFQEKNPRHIQG